MQQTDALNAFAALAHPTRLEVFRHLVRAIPSPVPALTLASKLDARPSTLSGHLSVMKGANLVTTTRNHREVLYAANLATINALIGFLLSDCCGGQMERCGDILSLLGCCEPSEKIT
mgnify:CR=1 FL=1